LRAHESPQPPSGIPHVLPRLHSLHGLLESVIGGESAQVDRIGGSDSGTAEQLECLSLFVPRNDDLLKDLSGEIANGSGAERGGAPALVQRCLGKLHILDFPLPDLPLPDLPLFDGPLPDFNSQGSRRKRQSSFARALLTLL
jgi:hypothetical protein